MIDQQHKVATLYRAPYVVPVLTPVISDGGVLVAEGRIVGVDRYHRLRPEADRVVELGGRVVVPALINCHCHLELSYLAPLGREEWLPPAEITAWIRELLARRAQETPEESIAAAGRKALDHLHRRGVAVVADIGNQPTSGNFGHGSEIEHLFFHELMAMTERGAEATLADLGPAGRYTAHAPYSCHPFLLKAVKETSRRVRGLFPIHVAESEAEIEFLTSGGGPFREFLSERLRLFGILAEGQELGALFPTPGLRAVEYLDELACLDERTICVHAVHLTSREMETIAARGAKVCLCPGSNRRLGVGIAPLPLMLRSGILPGLGTDSLTSNTTLDLWQEMRLAQQDHPGVPPELIFRMATQGGAETLGVTERLGGLAPGLAARLLSVPFTGQASEIFSYLVNGGEAIDPEWLEMGHGR